MPEPMSGCWLWVGMFGYATNYGKFTLGKQSVVAHRFAYTLFRGEIPHGMQLDHLCRNRQCVNPAHLEPVTIRENLLRGAGVNGQNAAKTHCLRGHAFTPENTRVDAKNKRCCRACQRWYWQQRAQKARGEQQCLAI